MDPKKNIQLDTVMGLLGLSALELSRHCGISNSLISRWQKGLRPLTPHTKALEQLTDTLVRLDSENKLDELLRPWRSGGETKKLALRFYLTGEELPVFPSRAQPPALQQSGAYVTQQQVLLGTKGFHQGALIMLDYVMKLPPGQRVVVCAHNGFELWFKNLPFALQFLHKLNKATNRGTTFVLVNHIDAYLDEGNYFSVYWLGAHLKGILRSYCYKGEKPPEYFVGVIPGYWSGCAERDTTAEDSLITTMYTDPRSVLRDERHCEAYIEKSALASQYGFFRQPQGDGENRQAWVPGPLPCWDEPGAALPDGSFSAICRLPSLGVMTWREFEQLSGKGPVPQIPDYLFSTARFASAPHRIILCREDVREGLLKARRRSEPLSELLHRRVFVPRAMLIAQLERILDAMKKNKAFEVALMPRSAFQKLEIEFVYWHSSAAVGWLQNGRESVFTCDATTAGNFRSAAEYAWDRLHKGWKRRRNVMLTLHKWLSGAELDTPEKDSAAVQNWEVMPRK